VHNAHWYIIIYIITQKINCAGGHHNMPPPPATEASSGPGQPSWARWANTRQPSQPHVSNRHQMSSDVKRASSLNAPTWGAGA